MPDDDGDGGGISRIGALGGSFDPIHFGHLMMAQDALEAVGLDRVCFIPAGSSPFKDGRHVASPRARYRMVKDAVRSHLRFEVLDWELKDEGPSYTERTVSRLRKKFPRAELYWIMGADQLPGLPQWRNIREWMHELTFVALGRPGADLATPGFPGLKVVMARGHLMELSSTEIRARVAGGMPIDFMVPKAVDDRIRRDKLYPTGNV